MFAFFRCPKCTKQEYMDHSVVKEQCYSVAEIKQIAVVP